MKKLLYLFIPLMCFFGCEDDDDCPMDYNCSPEYGCFQIEIGGQYGSLEECEDVCSQCNCGEVVEIDYTPAYAGELVEVAPGQYVTVDAHEAYSITEIKMYCSGDMISICDDLEMGELFCFDYVGDCYIAGCTWALGAYYNANEGYWVEEYMEVQSITLADGELTTYGTGWGLGSETILIDCD